MKWILMVTAIVLAACGVAGGPDIGPAPTTTMPEVTTTVMAGVVEPKPSDLDLLAAEARAALAVRLGVKEGDIEIGSVEQVTWTDGSIGCPQPGYLYTQALVDGVLIILRHGGLEYAYHQSGDDDPFYCEYPADG
jgi:hypothetical protein